MTDIDRTKAVRLYKIGGYSTFDSEPGASTSGSLARTVRDPELAEQIRNSTRVRSYEKSDSDNEGRSARSESQTREKVEIFEVNNKREPPRAKNGKIFAIRGTTKTVIEVTTTEVVEDNPYKVAGVSKSALGDSKFNSFRGDEPKDGKNKKNPRDKNDSGTESDKGRGSRASSQDDKNKKTKDGTGTSDGEGSNKNVKRTSSTSSIDQKTDGETGGKGKPKVKKSTKGKKGDGLGTDSGTGSQDESPTGNNDSDSSTQTEIDPVTGKPIKTKKTKAVRNATGDETDPNSQVKSRKTKKKVGILTGENGDSGNDDPSANSNEDNGNNDSDPNKPNRKPRDGRFNIGLNRPKAGHGGNKNGSDDSNYQSNDSDNEFQFKTNGLAEKSRMSRSLEDKNRSSLPHIQNRSGDGKDDRLRHSHKHDDDTKFPFIINEKPRPHVHRFAFKEPIRPAPAAFYDPGYKRCPCLMHNRLYYHEDRPPADQEERHGPAIRDYWHDHHDYELVYGRKFLSHYPAKPTMKDLEAHGDASRRTPWNPAF